MLLRVPVRRRCLVIDVVGAVVADAADLHPVEEEAEVLGAGGRAVGGLGADHDLPDRVRSVGDLFGLGPGGADVSEEAIGIVGQAGGGGGGLVDEVHARGV